MWAAKSSSTKPRNNTHLHGRNFIQPKLKVGRTDDKYEREADRVADSVMRMPDNQLQRQPVEEEEEEKVQMETGDEEEELQMQPLEEEEEELQMKCKECEEKEKMRMKPVIRKQEEGTPYASPEITDQINATKGRGTALAPDVQQEMSQKMGADFSNVQVHTDTRAARMNQALGARAFTQGNDIYFNSGEYRPDTSGGKRLLAHELTHVVQQNSKSKKNSIQRSVAAGKTNCPANTNNAPDNPTNRLEAINDTAVRYARSTAVMLEAAAGFARAGLSDFLGAEYERAFGLPPSSGDGFVNRMTGEVRPSREIALSEEMEIFSNRFDRIADFLEQPIAYRCDPPLSWGGCNFSACDANDNAAACTGVGAIKICPQFWNYDEAAQAGILIHEVTHIYWTGATHDVPSNLQLSQCYEELVAQIYGFNAQSQVCPTP